MFRTLAIASLLAMALTGCAGTAMRNPGLMAEADRSEQRAIAAQKSGAREVAAIQDERADRLRAQAKGYTLADGIFDSLFNMFLDSSAPLSKRR